MEGREATQTIATLGGFFQRPLPPPGEPGVMDAAVHPPLAGRDRGFKMGPVFLCAACPGYPDDAKAGVPFAAKQDKEAK